MSSRWPLIEGAILLAVAIGCIVFQLWLPSTHVTEAEYQLVAQTLDREAQPGDVVLLAPWWTERARMYLPAGLPIVGYLGSDSDALEKFQRIWVLAEPDLPRAKLNDFNAVFLPRRTEVGSERRFGRLSLRLFSNGRYRRTVFSGNALLADSIVALEKPDGSRVDCPWNGRAHQCPNGHAVGVAWHEVHYRPLLCLTFDAPGGDTKLVMELPPSAIHEAETAVLSAGYIWEHGAYVEGVTAAELGLEVDGQRALLTIPPGLEPLQQVERQPVREGAQVRIWLRSQRAQARDLCVLLDGFARSSP